MLWRQVIWIIAEMRSWGVGLDNVVWLMNILIRSLAEGFFAGAFSLTIVSSGK